MEFDIRDWVVKAGKESLFLASLEQLLKTPLYLHATKEQIEEVSKFTSFPNGYKDVDGKSRLYIELYGKRFYFIEHE